MVILLKSTGNNNINRLQKSRQTWCFWFFIYQIPIGISKRDEGNLIKKKKSLENYRADTTVSSVFC